jgi:hypothetical protein
VVVADDSLRSFRSRWTAPHSQGFSSSSNDDGVSLPSSVTPGVSSSGPAAEGRCERGLLLEGRGDSWAKRCARVVGDGGAFGSRRREWRLGLRVGMISSREMWCATGTISSLRALLCIGDGMVESLVPLAVCVRIGSSAAEALQRPYLVLQHIEPNTHLHLRRPRPCLWMARALCHCRLPHHMSSSSRRRRHHRLHL